MTAAEALALVAVAAFALGALVVWLVVMTWLRPLWESNAWWRSAPASVRDRITAQRAAAEQLEAQWAATQLEARRDAAQYAAAAEHPWPSGPDDVTAIMEGLPRIPAHEPPTRGETDDHSDTDTPV